MKYIDYDREIAKAWDALAEADDHNRGECLLVAANLHHQATHASETPVSDRLTGRLLELLADAEFAAVGRTDGRHATNTDLEPVLGSVLDRMAAEPDVDRRALLLKDVWDAVDDDTAAETVACLPYAPGMVGWRREPYLPSSFPQMVRAVWRTRRRSL